MENTNAQKQKGLEWLDLTILKNVILINLKLEEEKKVRLLVEVMRMQKQRK